MHCSKGWNQTFRNCFGHVNAAGETDTYRFAQLARDAALLSCGVPPQRMLPTEPRTDGALLKRVVYLPQIAR